MSFFALVVGKPLATTEERTEHMSQQVTWRMAFTADSFSISRMASLVGTMSNSTWRRSASSFTSFITGKRPYAPMPITSRWHFQDIFFSDGQGCMPKLVTEFPRRRLPAFADFSAIDHHVLLVRAAVDSEGTEGKLVEVYAPPRAAVFRRSSSK
jgi:hypothetical protein